MNGRPPGSEPPWAFGSSARGQGSQILLPTSVAANDNIGPRVTIRFRAVSSPTSDEIEVLNLLLSDIMLEPANDNAPLVSLDGP